MTKLWIILLFQAVLHYGWDIAYMINREGVFHKLFHLDKAKGVEGRHLWFFAKLRGDFSNSLIITYLKEAGKTRAPFLPSLPKPSFRTLQLDSGRVNIAGSLLSGTSQLPCACWGKDYVCVFPFTLNTALDYRWMVPCWRKNSNYIIENLAACVKRCRGTGWQGKKHYNNREIFFF